eukprot:356225-Chlamydomonas_euryale.AAC.13
MHGCPHVKFATACTCADICACTLPQSCQNSHLHAWKDDEQLDSKVWQLKHHATALSAPLLLPVVQPVWNQAPADADERLFGDDLFACARAPMRKPSAMQLSPA